MENQYRPELKAHVSVDAEGKVRHVLHSEELWRPTEEDPRRAAIEYVRAQAGLLEIADPALDRLDEPVTYTEPREEEESYRLAEEKRQFDSVTVAFSQTYLNVPVWRTGISVTVKAEPSGIVESTNTALAGVRAEMPSDEAIGRWRELSAVADGRAIDVGEAPAATPSDRMVRDALGLTEERAGETDVMAAVVRDADRLRVNQGRFFVYRYDPEERQPKAPDVDDAKVLDLEREDVELTFPLPPVPPTIQPGHDYLVAEVVFTLPFAGFDKLNWRALIEVETNAVLWLRALIAGVKGLVFTYDPITSTGVLTNTADQPNGVLDPLRDDVTLEDLSGPVAGVQSFRRRPKRPAPTSTTPRGRTTSPRSTPTTTPTTSSRWSKTSASTATHTSTAPPFRSTSTTGRAPMIREESKSTPSAPAMRRATGSDSLDTAWRI